VGGVAIVASMVRPNRDRAADGTSPSALAATNDPKATTVDAGAEAGTGGARPGATRDDAIVMPSDRIAQSGKKEPSETKSGAQSWTPPKPVSAPPAEPKPRPTATPQPTAWKHDPGF
jgi:hypothetical protein